MKGKSIKSVIGALETLIYQIQKRDKHKLVLFQSDNGSEFIAKATKEFLKERNIEQWFCKAGDHNCMGLIERFNRTLKMYLTKYLVHNNTTNWVDVLGDIMINYNSTNHKTIGIAPDDVNETKEERIFIDNIKETFSNIKEVVNPKVGDSFRFLLKKGMFAKEGQTYSDDVRIVQKVNKISIKDTEGNSYKFNEIQIIPPQTNTRETRATSSAKAKKKKIEDNHQAQLRFRRLMN